jgi:hypothetical protein
MAMQLKPGSRWRSDVCDAEVIVVKPGKTEDDLTCGGLPVKPAAEPRMGNAEKLTDGSGPQLGKRYGDELSGLEVLCNKAGRGELKIGDRPLLLRDARLLPSTD